MEALKRVPVVDRNFAGKRPSIDLFGRQIPMPQSRPVRITLGGTLVFLGMLGFLPVLGFWMIPLGLVVLSYDIARVRRARRRGVVWWERRRGRGR